MSQTIAEIENRPGQYIVSAAVDGFLLWSSSMLAMLSLVYCAVATFKYFFNRQGRIGASLSKLSYNVYIIHVVVMGPIAYVLLNTDIPALLKYPILVLTTWVVSNMLVFAYSKAVERLTA
ncbi:MAG: hypothetical protein IFK94_05700 [Acidobacteria bacterium]|uniref:Acyltransferase 3 domain-containing protein n=1 Tax=Candidatus Polarisedimenticola svalbardensis TaxID=2886004 RepID=A0A8J6Y7R1_9BACT|nr:hypothetical protein [Candidatus Polarisedimenticola svalbardensis]